MLGDSLEAIAGEKAGIFKPGIPAVVGDESPEIRGLLARRAGEAGATPMTVVDEYYAIHNIRVSTSGTSFGLTRDGGRHRITTPLLGAYQARNTTTAIATIAALGADYLPPASEISRALAKVFLPGRFHRRGRMNPEEARAFAQQEGLDSQVEPELDDALSTAKKGRGPMLVTGSFHTVGDVMSRLHVSPFAA